MGLERIRVSAVIPARAERIYRAWLDADQHSAITGAEAHITSRTGSKFTAHGGYITGKNLELERGVRILQSWRTSDFPDDAEDSTIEVTFKPAGGGTRVIISHGAIPEGQGEQYHHGWIKKYLGPMARYFMNHPEPDAVSTDSAQKLSNGQSAASSGSRRKPAPRTVQSKSSSSAGRTRKTAVESSGKASPRKPAAKKAAGGSAAKKAASKSAAKKTPAKKTTRKSATRKAPVKKAAAKKATAKKPPAKKAGAPKGRKAATAKRTRTSGAARKPGTRRKR